MDTLLLSRIPTPHPPLPFTVCLQYFLLNFWGSNFTIQHPNHWKWTGPSEKNRQVNLAEMGKCITKHVRYVQKSQVLAQKFKITVLSDKLYLGLDAIFGF